MSHFFHNVVTVDVDDNVSTAYCWFSSGDGVQTPGVTPGLEKKLEFQLALWTSNSQILFAPGKHPTDVLVRVWLTNPDNYVCARHYFFFLLLTEKRSGHS